jgi:hypothetical protein
LFSFRFTLHVTAADTGQLRFIFSAIDSLLQMRRVPIALHRDLRDRCVDIAEILGREFDVRSTNVLL